MKELILAPLKGIAFVLFMPFVGYWFIAQASFEALKRCLSKTPQVLNTERCKASGSK